jgi:phosphate transport system permease protein
MKSSQSKIAMRRWYNKFSYGLFFFSTSIGIIVLVTLIADIFLRGFNWFDWNFITNLSSRRPERAGILPGLTGTIIMIILTAPVAFVLGVGTAIYLEEYAKKNWFTRFIQLNISNLAGVPSIVFGLLGLTIFVQFFGLGNSILAGALTLALLVLPIIIVSAQEALKAVPDELRFGSYALGGTKWQTIFRIVLPSAIPGILTGNILALSRAIGETAPLIVLGAALITNVPSGPFSTLTAMPIQIFDWVRRPQADFHNVAAAGILLLMLVLLVMNSIAVILRNKFQKKY